MFCLFTRKYDAYGTIGEFTSKVSHVEYETGLSRISAPSEFRIII